MTEPNKVAPPAVLGLLYKRHIVYSSLHETCSYWLVTEVTSKYITIRNLLSDKTIRAGGTPLGYGFTLVE